MYGQGYRNKADRKRNSRFVVSEKIGPDTGRKEGGYAQNKKLKPSYGRAGSISQSPRRLRAKYTHRTNQRFVLRVFRPAGSQYSRKRQLVRKRMPMHPLTNEMAEFILPKTRRECRSEEIHLFK